MKLIYMKSISIFLISVALIAGVVSCDGVGRVISFNLITSSTIGGNVITPGEGNITYNEGTVANLIVEAKEGYYFVNWTGNVDTISNVNATATNITMNGHFTITANWEEVNYIVDTGGNNTVGIRSNSSAAGDRAKGQCGGCGRPRQRGG